MLLEGYLTSESWERTRLHNTDTGRDLMSEREREIMPRSDRRIVTNTLQAVLLKSSVTAQSSKHCVSSKISSNHFIIRMRQWNQTSSTRASSNNREGHCLPDCTWFRVLHSPWRLTSRHQAPTLLQHGRESDLGHSVDARATIRNMKGTIIRRRYKRGNQIA